VCHTATFIHTDTHNTVSFYLPIIRPHRITTYEDAAYCYQPSSLVCRSVTLVSPAKTAALIEMLFGLRTRVGPRNHVLDGGPDPPMQRGNFEGEGASHCKL